MSITFAPLQPETIGGEILMVQNGAHPTAVNVSNTNVSHLLETLGLDPMQKDGCIPGDDMLGRVLTAIATTDGDTGVEPNAEDSNGRVIDCGRRAGYTEDRLAELRDLAQFAYDNSAWVGWS